jgi:RNA polymerase sigma factor (sigma-70 family)
MRPTLPAGQRDERLLERFLAGDPATCRQVERWAWEIVYFKPYGIPRDEHEDLIQLTVAGVWRAASRPGFELRTELRALVRRVAMARCVDWIRRRRPTVEWDETTAVHSARPYDGILHADQSEQLRWALAALDPACRSTLEAHFLADTSYAEMAERESRTESTIRWRVHDCVKKIRALLTRWAAT